MPAQGNGVFLKTWATPKILLIFQFFCSRGMVYNFLACFKLTLSVFAWQSRVMARIFLKTSKVAQVSVTFSYFRMFSSIVSRSSRTKAESTQILQRPALVAGLLFHKTEIAKSLLYCTHKGCI